MIYIIQQSPETPAGTSTLWCETNKIPYQLIRADLHIEALPNVHALSPQTSGVILCGGGMNVDEEQKHPWLTLEKNWIQDCIKKEISILGLCLGGQLLAEALGARVSQHHQWEVGWHPLKMTNHPLLPNVDTLIGFQWHGYSFDTPMGAQSFATNDVCIHQGFIYKNHIMGLQFHPEATVDWIKECTETNDDEYPIGPYVQNRETILSHMKNQTPLQNWYFKTLDLFFKHLRTII